ncbi:hypothetical protein L6452_04005 [Arctium lappa]|uniref:Uncharacterized protein n=1 Tax=Arctium lappa TaxID=4217 RepID=A0ACB9FQ04_ARCLA|nr:hypothetical protein L6452_04005 [Arctium lappa]
MKLGWRITANGLLAGISPVVGALSEISSLSVIGEPSMLEALGNRVCGVKMWRNGRVCGGLELSPKIAEGRGLLEFGLCSTALVCGLRLLPSLLGFRAVAFFIFAMIQVESLRKGEEDARHSFFFLEIQISGAVALK